MPESILTILKICFLAMLYLFLARVLRTVWVEIFADRKAVAEDIAAQQARAAAVAAASGVKGTAPTVVQVNLNAKQGRRPSKRAKHDGWALKLVEPPTRRGMVFRLTDELTIGRAEACGVAIDDTFASQLHARVFARDNQMWLEDLGSTNGTFLNRKRVSAPVALRKGDRVQIGNTVLELQR